MKFLEPPTRNLFFTGKGGVGKTTVAAAVAVAITQFLLNRSGLQMDPQMKRLIFFILIFLAFTSGADAVDSDATDLFPELSQYALQRTAEFKEIPQERRLQLERLAEFVSGKLKDGKEVRLTFICTHNSRRSHFAQLWAQIAAIHYSLSDVQTYSGGTEVTAFNPRAVDALRRAGLQINSRGPTNSNPVYEVQLAANGPSIQCFSKRYDQPPNPASDFAAIMTCSEADASCPTVSGSEVRLAISYDDPKLADNSPVEVKTYDERCRQIAREMLFAFSLVSL